MLLFPFRITSCSPLDLFRVGYLGNISESASNVYGSFSIGSEHSSKSHVLLGNNDGFLFAVYLYVETDHEYMPLTDQPLHAA